LDDRRSRLANFTCPACILTSEKTLEQYRCLQRLAELREHTLRKRTNLAAVREQTANSRALTLSYARRDFSLRFFFASLAVFSCEREMAIRRRNDNPRTCHFRNSRNKQRPACNQELRRSVGPDRLDVTACTSMTQSSTQSPSRLSKRLAGHPHASRRRRHTATVLALREEIQTALDDGWSRLAIWEALFEEQRVQMKYDAFLRYLRRAGITGGRPRATTVPAPSPTPSHPSPRTPSAGFHFSARPNTEDLA
jgi:hypothetical protein